MFRTHSREEKKIEAFQTAEMMERKDKQKCPRNVKPEKEGGKKK